MNVVLCSPCQIMRFDPLIDCDIYIYHVLKKAFPLVFCCCLLQATQPKFQYMYYIIEYIK